MKQATYVSIQEEPHWFELNHAGELTHVIHRFDTHEKVSSWKLHDDIQDYQLVAISGVQHAVVLTKSGLYYVKVQDAQQYQQAVRMENYEGVSSLFISLQDDTIYIGYMRTDQEQISFVLRTYQHGVWRASVNPIPYERAQASVPVVSNQAVYTMNGEGVLYGLLKMDDMQAGTSVLWSFMLKTSIGEAVWQYVYETKSSSSAWECSICHDAAGYCHASWAYRQEESIHHFYRRLHSLQNHQFRYISFEPEVPRPYFISQQSNLSLLFIYNGEKVLYTCSQDEGEHWSNYQEMQFQTGFPLLIVQGVRKDQEMVTTYPEIGFATPIFRPLTWSDMVNPFNSFKALLPFNPIASYMTYQLNQMELYMKQELIKFQRDMSQLVQRKQQLEQQIVTSREELERLTAVEQLLLEELDAERNQQSAERFPLRRIQ